jgi:hypothetical protein
MASSTPNAHWAPIHSTPCRLPFTKTVGTACDDVVGTIAARMGRSSTLRPNSTTSAPAAKANCSRLSSRSSQSP